jgi:hypothetical protein
MLIRTLWYSCISTITYKELEASASSGRAGAMGETTSHATGHATGSGPCRLSMTTYKESSGFGLLHKSCNKYGAELA